MTERKVIRIELDVQQSQALIDAFVPALKKAIPGTLAIIGQPINDLSAVRFTLLSPEEMRAVFAVLNPEKVQP